MATPTTPPGPDWAASLNAAITVCNPDGVILWMNQKAMETFKKDGGNLVGKNVFDCHPEPARTKLKGLMERQQSNIYTIEKKGKKKLIHQAPWHEGGVYGGFVEISIELPDKMPYYKRD